MTATLFDPARHEPISGEPWDAARAREAIATIVADIEDAMDHACTWPWHPNDTRDVMKPRFRSPYWGSAGVLWALGYLERQGAARLRLEIEPLFERLYPAYIEKPDTGEVVPSYLFGEVGILLPLWRMNGSPEVAARLASAIERNIENETNEFLWGAPGTMLAALQMHAWTAEDSWKALYLRNVEYLWRTWIRDDRIGCYMWTQDLYGEIVQFLGAGHGFAGNAYALLRGASLLPQDQREALYDRCVEALSATVLEEGDCANWPPNAVATAKRPDPKRLVQWCHGAPGIVTGLADFPAGRSPGLDALLVKGGNLVWKAGPLQKGHNLCHGTAGNGYAFLKLHQRTGDAVWLERARSFAMHAIGQSETMRRQYGQGRYSLWTGDPGLAIFLWHCIVRAGGMPSLDFFD